MATLTIRNVPESLLDLDAPLITADRRVLRVFPMVAVSLEAFAA